MRSVNQRSVSRRRGMANILGGISEQDLLTLHQTYRSHTPTTPVEEYDATDDASRDPFSDVIVNDDAAVLNRPDSRQRTRRNAICYNADTEQIIRNIVRDVHIATYLNDLKLKNGYVQ